MGNTSWKQYSTSIVVKPDGAIRLPPDRRHRWILVKKSLSRQWFRCQACQKRRSTLPFLALLGQKYKQARKSMQDTLDKALWSSSGTNPSH